MGTRILAFICRICPFCISARRWPESKFAKKLREVERNCPACRAYAELYGRTESRSSEDGPAQP
jgi:hypothetical protein